MFQPFFIVSDSCRFLRLTCARSGVVVSLWPLNTLFLDVRLRANPRQFPADCALKAAISRVFPVLSVQIARYAHADIMPFTPEQQATQLQA
jgi:hypothetical protein